MNTDANQFLNWSTLVLVEDAGDVEGPVPGVAAHVEEGRVTLHLHNLTHLETLGLSWGAKLQNYE